MLPQLASKSLGNHLFATSTVFMVLACACVRGEVLVHETFSDNNILDGNPAVWEYSCQSPYGGCAADSELVLQDGDAEATINSFVGWSLAEVDGQKIAPDNHWSIRARITGQSSSNSLVAVGIDSYHWAAGIYKDSQVSLGLGNPFSSNGGNRRHDFFKPWVVQLDVFPDRLEAYRWPADDPGSVDSATWSNSESIAAGRPSFGGNWGGKPLFHEVVVADSPMGVGGDFDLSDELDLDDLDALSEAIRSGENDPRYNLTNDEVVDLDDLDVWLADLKQTNHGDANLDGTVNFEDFLALSANFGTDGGWQQGDFDADGSVGFSDFLKLAENFEQPAAAMAAASVPEPTAASYSVWAIGLCLMAVRRRPKAL